MWDKSGSYTPGEIDNCPNPLGGHFGNMYQKSQKRPHVYVDLATALVGICPREINGHMLKLEII